MVPELFVMPAPLMVNVNEGLAVIVNALPAALNTVALTSVLADRETAVVLEVAKKAMSDGPLGGPSAVQFVAVFQSPLTGDASHVALPASAVGNSAKQASGMRRKASRKGDGLIEFFTDGVVIILWSWFGGSLMFSEICEAKFAEIFRTRKKVCLLQGGRSLFRFSFVCLSFVEPHFTKQAGKMAGEAPGRPSKSEKLSFGPFSDRQ